MMIALIDDTFDIKIVKTYGQYAQGFSVLIW